jgi:S1-C subfamily serine protease
MGVLEDIGTAVSSAAERGGSSVVGIAGGWPGSGVVVGPGLVLTNAHNVRGESVRVTFADGRAAEGTLAGSDHDGDLAVVAVDTGDAPTIAWGDGDLGMGSPVVGLANPGGRGLRATLGMVSGVDRSFRGPRGRRIAGGVEHTAPLPRGASGGPIVDAEGRLLGINTHRSRGGFYVALPADRSLRKRVEALGRGEHVERPRLGIGVAPAPVARRLRRAVGLPERDGVLVRVVEDGAPAQAAGLEGGDLIVEVNGTPVTTADDIAEALEGGPDPVRLRVVRGTEEREVAVSLGDEGVATGSA